MTRPNDEDSTVSAPSTTSPAQPSEAEPTEPKRAESRPAESKPEDPAASVAPPHDSALDDALPASQTNGDTLALTAPSPTRGTAFTGATLWTFGALLWTYVVVGKFVLEARFPESLGALVVLGAYVWAWYRSSGHHRGRSELMFFGPGAAGLVLMLVVLALASSVLGSNHRKEIEAVRVGLWTLGLISYFIGRNLAATPRKAPTKLRRAAQVAIWSVVGLATIAALVATVSRL